MLATDFFHVDCAVTLQRLYCLFVVTALTAEAASFSGRMCLTRSQSGPGVDVACPVNVGVHAAVRGTDNSVLLRAGASPPALVTVDTRVSREGYAKPRLIPLGDFAPKISKNPVTRRVK